MKHKSKSLPFLLSLSLIATIVPGNPILSGARAAGPAARGAAAQPAAPQGGPGQALKQGRALLKRGKADQALAQLQSALNQFK